MAFRPLTPPVVKVKNPDGSYSSERTISVSEAALNRGRETVIPSLVAGKQLSDKEAVRSAIRSGLNYPSFGNVKRANEYTAARTKAGGATTQGFLGTSPMAAIPTYPTTTRKKRKAKLSDLTKFGSKAPSPKSKDTYVGKKPYKTSSREELKRGVASGLATASAGISGRGTAGRMLKAGLAGAAGGAKIEAAYLRYKDKRARSRAKKAKTTVSQSAMAQKAQYHKKDPTSTERH